MRALLAFVIAFMPAAALACSPAPWPGETPPTAQMVGDQALANQPKFLGKVEVVSMSKDDSEEARYELRVLKQYMGEPVENIPAVTNETNSCSFFGKAGDVILVALNKDVEEDYNISSLSSYFFGVPSNEVEAYLDQWKAGGQPVPALAPESAAAPDPTIEVQPEPAATQTPAVAPSAATTTESTAQ